MLGKAVENLAAFSGRIEFGLCDNLEIENKPRFMKTVLKTDYRFKSKMEAKRIMGFFFGEEMENNLIFTGEGIVREFTGAWHLKV